MKRARLAAITLCWLAACGAGVNEETSGAGGTGSGGAGPGQGGSTTGEGASGGGFDPTTTGVGGGLPEIAEVFGHSASTLYRLDPDTKEVTVVGDFNGGCSSIIDIALDKDSKLIGTTFSGLYWIDKTTAACTEIAAGGYPNSLSFVPAGVLDPANEVLVGYEGSTYVRIDTVTGQKTTVGSLGDGGLASSGDVVSVKDGKTFLTVVGVGCSSDCLIEVNPATGQIVKNWGPLGYAAVYGIAFWAGSVYGFNEGGSLFEVTFVNDVMATTLITQPPGTSFWGAGSTTSAPPIPIPD
jgi:hypothetical protein